ncbi:MAG: DNA-directed RNA polymerase subunit K [Nanoarchaeota archaeon]|nr:DNA-directed RNA polymerase subunit K [Nanoarchaeota archaeon]
MKLTKYEKARLVGARALQIAMGAPLLLKLSKAEFESMHYRPVAIAKLELEKEVLPITIKRPLPFRVETEQKAA